MSRQRAFCLIIPSSMTAVSGLQIGVGRFRSFLSGQNHHGRKSFGRSAEPWQKSVACRFGSPANATSHLGFSGKELQKTLDNLYYEEELAPKDVILARDGLDLIPPGEPLAYAQQKLAGASARDHFTLAGLFF